VSDFESIRFVERGKELECDTCGVPVPDGEGRYVGDYRVCGPCFAVSAPAVPVYTPEPDDVGENVHFDGMHVRFGGRS